MKRNSDQARLIMLVLGMSVIATVSVFVASMMPSRTAPGEPAARIVFQHDQGPMP